MNTVTENILIFGLPGILLLVLICFMFFFKKSTNGNPNLRSSCWGVDGDDDGKEACQKWLNKPESERGADCNVCKSFKIDNIGNTITCCEKE